MIDEIFLVFVNKTLLSCHQTKEGAHKTVEDLIEGSEDRFKQQAGGHVWMSDAIMLELEERKVLP